MKRQRTEKEFHKQVISGARSLWDTFYWIDEALARHIREFKAREDVADAMLGDSDQPIDLIARLGHLRADAAGLRRDVDRTWLFTRLRPWVSRRRSRTCRKPKWRR